MVRVSCVLPCLPVVNLADPGRVLVRERWPHLASCRRPKDLSGGWSSLTIEGMPASYLVVFPSVVTYEAGVRSTPASSETVSLVAGWLCVVCSLASVRLRIQVIRWFGVVSFDFIVSGVTWLCT